MKLVLLLIILAWLGPSPALAGCSWFAEKDPSLRIDWSDSHVVMGYRGVVNLGGSNRFPLEIICSNGYMVCTWLSTPSPGVKHEGHLVPLEDSRGSKFVVSYLGKVAWYGFGQSLRDRVGLFDALDGFWIKSPECNTSGWFE